MYYIDEYQEGYNEQNDVWFTEGDFLCKRICINPQGIQFEFNNLELFLEYWIQNGEYNYFYCEEETLEAYIEEIIKID